MAVTVITTDKALFLGNGADKVDNEESIVQI